MSSKIRCKGVVYYVPKERIRRKVEKPEYKDRYQKRVNGRAVYNLLGKLVAVRMEDEESGPLNTGC